MSSDRPRSDGLDPEAWRRLDTVFAEALELPPEEVDAFLRERVGDDEELRRQVEGLLRAEAGSGGFLETPLDAADWMRASADASESLRDSAEAEAEGEVLGPYRLTELIGRGGMADVYLGVRSDDAYRREVAVKRMRTGLVGERMHHRFLRERQILAGLEHPGIARLYDGGTDAAGRPYLVMELVEGKRLDAHCDERRATLDERLGLFLALSKAVQCAHRSLLVHRDLKPSNVLVTPEGEVKLLDFGIAKELTAVDDLTRTGSAPLSLSYASPEQVRGEEITTASDVFSLGVVLYELLSGCRPYRFDGPPLPHDLTRAVCEETPPLMSSAVGGRGDAEERALRRGLSARELRRRLTGDLDSIVAKALEKDPRRRYSSVEQLAEDLERYRGDRPVKARRRGNAYLAAKFVRRHRLGVAAAVAFAALGVAFVLLQIDQARRMKDERDKVTRAMNFMVELFDVSRPGTPLGEDVPAQQLLDKAARRATLELRDEPEVQGTLLDTLGRIYANLGLVKTAEDLLREALSIRARGSRPGPELGETLHHLAEAVALRSDDEEAVALFDRALAAQQEIYGEDHPAVAEIQRSKADWLSLMQRYEEAEILARKAVATLEAKAPESLDLARAREQLAIILQETGQTEQALALATQTLKDRRRIYGNDHPQIVASLDILAGVLKENGEIRESVRWRREAVEMRRRISAPTDPDLLISLHSLAVVLRDAGEPREAEALHREILEQLEAVFPGEDHIGKGSSLFNLANLVAERGDHEEAHALARRDLEMSVRLFGERHPRTAPSWLNVGRHQRGAGDLVGSERTLRKAVEIFEETRSPGHPGRPMPKVELGATLQAQGRLHEAVPLLRSALASLQAALPPTHTRVATASIHLGSCLAARGSFGEAESFLLSGFEVFRGRGEAARGLDWAREELVSLYRAWGRPDEAQRFELRSP